MNISKIKKYAILLLPIFALMLILSACSSSSANPETQPLDANNLTKKEKIAAVLVYAGQGRYSEAWYKDYRTALKKKLRACPLSDDYPGSYEFTRDVEYGLPMMGEDGPAYTIVNNKINIITGDKIVDKLSFKSIVKSLNKDSLQGKVRKVAKNLVVKKEYQRYKE